MPCIINVLNTFAMIWSDASLHEAKPTMNVLKGSTMLFMWSFLNKPIFPVLL